MPDLTYARLQNNIVDESVEDGYVYVSFRCPATGRIHHALTEIKRRADETPQGTRALLSVARQGLGHALQSALGEGPPVRPANGQSEVADRGALESAVIEAFEAVADQFAWDVARGAFVDIEALESSVCEFDRQLRRSPLTRPNDRRIAAKVLMEVAGSDGKIEESERRLLRSLFSENTMRIDPAAMQRRTSPLELDETSPAVRETILMLAHAIALCDDVMSTAERQRLTELAALLGVNQEHDAELHLWAAEKMLELVLRGCYADGRLDAAERERIGKLAGNMGVNVALVAKIDVRVRTRRGL